MSRIALKSRVAFLFFAAAMPLMAAESPGCDPLAFYDSIMPNVVSDQDQLGMDEVILIRYIPGDTSLYREYQIKILLSSDGKIIARRREPVGTSLRNQLRKEEALHPEAMCEFLLKALRTQDHDFADRAALKTLVADLSRIRVGVRLPASIYFDAARYEIVDWSRMNQASFVIYAARDTSQNGLLRWAKKAGATIR